MGRILIKNGNIISDNLLRKAHIVIHNDIIEKIFNSKSQYEHLAFDYIIDASDKLVIPGIIDDQVHFRDPGLTHKADIYTESKAAIAGGVTSFMDLPNVNPPSTTIDLLEKRFAHAAKKSLANYSFYLGTTNNNLDEIQKIDPKKICGIKVFMGSSTGNMLVDDPKTLNGIFETSPVLIATHCEDETTIRKNLETAKHYYGIHIPFSQHPVIRSAESCYLSSSLAISLAKKYHSRLHVYHLTTAKEMSLFTNTVPLSEKQITAEVCTHHLWFDDSIYQKIGSWAKCNPAIKSASDRKALLQALIEDKIDVIATDHAPHTLQEKDNHYLDAPSGLPMVQHGFNIMFELYLQGIITLEKIVEKMCHNPSIAFKIKKRGFLREGYYADIVIIDTDTEWTVNFSNILYKCGWSPLEGQKFHSKVTHTFVNGHLVYQNGIFDESKKGRQLVFDR
ncbi:MAG TPA: dihydroorotase [Bacteroidales bacterium]|nr:dihydroorotase [Bacteroidales bacterium]